MVDWPLRWLGLGPVLQICDESPCAGDALHSYHQRLGGEAGWEGRHDEDCQTITLPSLSHCPLHTDGAGASLAACGQTAATCRLSPLIGQSCRLSPLIGCSQWEGGAAGRTGRGTWSNVGHYHQHKLTCYNDIHEVSLTYRGHRKHTQPWAGAWLKHGVEFSLMTEREKVKNITESERENCQLPTGLKWAVYSSVAQSFTSH